MATAERQSGQLAVRSLVSGELMTTVSAEPSWTVNEVTCAILRADGRGPPALAQHLAVRLFVENQPMDPRNSLEQLGNEVQVLIVDYLEDQSFREKFGRMEADLKRLKPDIFDELRYEPKPSLELLDVVCPIKLLLEPDKDDLSWHEIRKMLRGRGLHTKLREFSIDSAPLETLVKLREMVAKSNLELDRLKRRSFAAAWLSSWVLVMHQCAVAKLEFYSM